MISALHCSIGQAGDFQSSHAYNTTPTDWAGVLDLGLSSSAVYQQVTHKRPLRSVKGLCADLKVDITEEDIAQARKEMWGNFRA